MSGDLRGAVRAIPRITESFSASNATFSVPTFNGVISGYLEAVTTIPLILLAVGCLAVLFLQFFLCLRCCVPSLKCAAVQSRNGQSLGEFKYAVERKRRSLIMMALLFGLISACSINLIFYAGTFFTDSLNILDGAIVYLLNATSKLSNANSIIFYNNDKVITYLNSIQTSGTADSACRSAAAAVASGATVSSASSSVSETLISIRSPLETLNDYTTNYAPTYQNYFVYGYYGVSMSLVLAFLLGSCFQLKCMIQFYILCTELYILLLTLLVSTLLIILMVLSDFCEAPYDLVLSVALTNGTAHDIAAYYTHCNGTNPFASQVDLAHTACTSLASNVTALMASTGACPSEPALVSSSPLVSEMLVQVSYINDSLACPGLSQQYHGIVDDGLCGSLFEALFITAVTFLGTSAFLFALVCVVSVVYQFFGSLWRMGVRDNRVGDVEGGGKDDEDGEQEDFLLQDKSIKP